ncbi:hypothetical protein GQ44DRAFT_703601 [Phaeosphaeriaceae sp. PMI808]|nr:hypothetical protein GQ44DRAFT_703601 [Phaeosphaeriaceae sp. PMI808]
MHWPSPFVHNPKMFPKDSAGKTQPSSTDYIDTYLAMQACVRKGKARVIGVSNFSKAELDPPDQGDKSRPSRSPTRTPSVTCNNTAFLRSTRRKKSTLRSTRRSATKTPSMMRAGICGSLWTIWCSFRWARSMGRRGRRLCWRGGLRRGAL